MTQDTIIIILAAVCVLSVMVNLIMTAVMFAKLADTVGRILEQALLREFNNNKSKSV